MKRLPVLFAILVTLYLFQACKKNGSPSQNNNKGVLSGSITGPGSQSVSGASIIVFNANTNLPVVTSTTGANGSYSIQLDPGSYYIKVYAQGYESVPMPGLTPVPFTITISVTTTINYQMNALAVGGAGLISGKVVTSAGGPIPGVLVVAHSGANGYSSVSDNNGNYVIYNVPTNNYSVQGFIAAYTSDSLAVAVASVNTPVTANLTLTSGAAGSVTGSVTFLATANKEVDVSIVNPYTKESIPGLSTMTVGGSYSMSNVPSGNYIARASFKNDTIVMDPDWILKNGQPAVTVAGAPVTRNFSVTGSVILDSPTNAPSSTTPQLNAGSTPTLTWTAYPSASDYAIEVSDEEGNVIWGGFSGSGSAITRNVTVPASQTTVQYNFDGKGEPLQTGHYYRWRIYACKNVTGTPSWKLISVSEDQMGLIMP
jgi:hypothetical protein